MRIFVTCPSDKFPKDEKKPKIEVLSFCLEAKGTNSCKASDNIAKVLGIEDNINDLDYRDKWPYSKSPFITPISFKLLSFLYGDIISARWGSPRGMTGARYSRLGS